MTSIRRNLSTAFGEALKDSATDKVIDKNELKTLETKIKTKEDKEMFESLTKDQSHLSFKIEEGKDKGNFDFDVSVEFNPQKKAEKVFSDPTSAQKFLNGMSNQALNTYFTPEAALTRFEADFRVSKVSTVPTTNIGISTIDFNKFNFSNLKSFSDLKNAVVSSYQDHITDYQKPVGPVSDANFTTAVDKVKIMAQLIPLLNYAGVSPGAIPIAVSKSKIESFIKDNPDNPAQIMGDFLAKQYKGLVSLTGDVAAYETLKTFNGVCTDIHAGISALRVAAGQEAYVVNSSGNDAFHAFSIFKDKDNTWSIQNYGNIYTTKAKTIEELFDTVMPEQRYLSLSSVTSDGKLIQTGEKYRTATGLREEMFRGFTGTGTGSPTDTNGFTAGTPGIKFTKDGMKIEYSEKEATLGLGWHDKTETAGSKTISGKAGQFRFDGPLPGGDIKLESETVTDDGKNFGRTYWNIFQGLEISSSPNYWPTTASAITVKGDPIYRIGGRFETNQSSLYGSGSLKGEFGYGFGGGGALTVDVSGKTKPFPYAPVASYGGQSFQNALLYGNVSNGIFYKPNDNLIARAGLTSGISPGNGKVDGIMDTGKQLGNMLDLKVYSDVRYSLGNFAANGLLNVHLNHPGNFELGLGAAYIDNNYALGATYFMRPSVSGVLDNLKLNATWMPDQNGSFSGYLQTPVFGASAPAQVGFEAQIKG